MAELDAVLLVHLCELSERYILPFLKNICEIWLEKHICMESVCMLLDAAEKYCCSSLMSKAVEFALMRFTDMIVADEFLKLPEKVLKKIFEEVHKRGCKIGR